ncbi:MAG: pitrilysin family protein, partial [Bdellovibrionota bacterium]
MTAIKVLSLVLLLGSFGATGCRTTTEALGIRLELTKKVLSNGLTAILVEDHSVPIVSYQTWFRAGSVDEVPGITGIAHYFEHLMFKGTPKYGPKQFFQQLEAKGAEVNAYTARDYTVYYENFTPDLLEKVIDMEADRLANLALTEEILATERQVVLEERRLRTENSPSGRLQEAIWALAYQRHPYHFPVIGTFEDVVSIKLSDLRDFFARYYTASNATVILVGNFDTNRAWDLIEKHYKALPSKPRPERKVPREPLQNEERRLTLHDEVTSERFVRGYHVTKAEDDDSYAIDVLANILFEGTTSRAHRVMVEETEAALGVSGSAYTPTYPGLFLMTATMKEGVTAAKGEELLDQLISEIQSKPVTAEEVAIAVRQLTMMLVDSVRTPSGLAQLIGTVQAIFGDAG